MKKSVLLFVVMLFAMAICVVGCKKDSNDTVENDKLNINVGCMKGPTGIGMIKMLSDSNKGNTKNVYKYTISGTADEISTALIKGDLDVAAVPCNLASVLYNKTDGDIVTVAINTFGVLYIVENGESVASVEDLKGKTIYSTGQGTTPEYTLRYLLESAGIDPDTDVDIQYKSEGAEVVAAMLLDEDAVAMLPQPYVTVALNKIENSRIAIDVTKEWEKLNEGSTVVTGVLVARKDFIEKNKDSFKEMLEEYKASTEYANSNIDDTAKLLAEFDIFAESVAKSAIPYCNVTYITGNDMKEKAMAYLSVIYAQNKNAVGGSVQEGMFYIEK